MTTKYFNLQNRIIALLTIAIFSLSCSEDQATDNSDDDSDTSISTTKLLEIDGTVFSIPSPIQTAYLILNSGSTYNKDVLNAPSQAKTYSTNYKRALNLGVYGADLAYITLYNQTNDAISFLTALKTLGDNLGLSNAFNKDLLDRFEQNIGNQDSLLAFVSDTYKSSDRYLKDNDQNDIGGLILAGGWIESLYFATSTAMITSNQDVINRIGEQKITVYNLIKLLMPYYDQPEFTTLIDDLKELEELFSKVKISYTYVKPTTDIENRITTINSVTKVNITSQQFDAITQKIIELRIDIIS